MSGKDKTETKRFFSGVAILSLSTFLVKFIGLIYKIPLLRILGALGMGYFNSAYEIYAIICAVSTAGLPVALSILVSESRSKKSFSQRSIYRAGVILFSLIGAIGSAIMFFFADGFSELIGNPSARFSIAALSPALFVVCLASAVRGYFQGKQNMTPTALSQFVEAAGKLIFGVLLALYAKGRGADAAVCAACAVAGVSLGSLFSLLYLLIRKAFAKDREISKEKNNYLDIFSRLAKIALPISLSSLVMGASKLVDLSLILRRLQDIGYSNSYANVLYGSYTTLAVPLFNLVPSLLASVSLALVPSLTACVAKRDTWEQRRVSERALGLVASLAIPAALCFAFFSEPILSLLFSGETSAVSIASPLLSLISGAVCFSCLISVTNAILQAYNKATLPIISMCVGAAVKLVSAYILLGIPEINISGAPISTLLCDMSVCVCNFYFIGKRTPLKFDFRTVFIKPFFAALCSVSFGGALYLVLIRTSLEKRICTLAAFALIGCLYIALTLVLGVIKKDDIGSLPVFNKKVLKRTEEK